MRDDDDEEWGVLLYYKFVALADPAREADYLQRLCSSLSLRGRLRVAPDGVNVTVTGTLAALHAHTAALAAHPRFAFPPIDFKLSPAPAFAAVPPHLALACGFASLSVRLVPHLITLAPEPPSISNAGPLVSPREFHELLQQDCVLLDARNVYETRIGKFQPPPNVQFLDPLLRQYSDLPGWIDAHQEQFRNKRVLMYCTGGVRCELASSYLRSKGKEFEDVIQLSGGIHRYMEAFADGGYFKGKNFVFDHRMAVASSNEEIVGRCLLCQAPFDDYSARNRCSLCRLLVLICNACQGAGDSTATNYVCELCEVNQKASGQREKIGEKIGAVCKIINDVPTTEHIKLAADLKTPLLHEGRILNQKLRVLCLHGFRQNASGFKGRLGSLKKKLKHVVDFVFVDAPHKLPFIQQDRSTVRHGSLSNGTSSQIPTCKYAWLVSPNGEVCGNECLATRNSTGVQQEDAEVEGGITKTAAFDAWQYETQTEGWGTSWEYLQKVFHELGPFDGVLGFSQGAAVAAALCQLHASVHFRFAVLCSGYRPPFLFAEAGTISCPSLHIYGDQDRQIHDRTSEQLADLFRDEERTIVKHGCGHLIPTQPAYVEQYLQFFSRFL